MNIQKVGVVGAGQMGNGIAHVCALAGYDVVMEDVNPEALGKAKATIERNLQRQAVRGIITQPDVASALSRIRTANDLEVMRDRDLVIEAATEDEQVKRKIYRDLCPRLGANHDAGEQHIFDFDHAACRRHRPPGKIHWPAFHESGAHDAAGRDHPRYCDR